MKIIRLIDTFPDLIYENRRVNKQGMNLQGTFQLIFRKNEVGKEYLPQFIASIRILTSIYIFLIYLTLDESRTF